MIPEIDVQLAAVAKSLADNILPAIDAANPQAQEQMQLCLATLAIVRQRLPDLHAFLLCDLEDNLALLRTLGGDDPDSERLLEYAQAGPHEIEAQVRQLKDRIANMIDAARGTPQERAVASNVLAAQASMILRARAWAIGMGFEPDAAQIPDLATLMNKAELV
jgi:hypothetical protein